MKLIHPALSVYQRLFREAAAEDTPLAPSGFVHETYFQRALVAAGIECPSGFCEFSDWCESIGVPEYAHRLAMRHHRERGTSPSPMERRAWSQRRMLRKLQTA